MAWWLALKGVIYGVVLFSQMSGRRGGSERREGGHIKGGITVEQCLTQGHSDSVPEKRFLRVCQKTVM